MDNGSHFEGEVQRIMELYNIKHHKSSPYRLQTKEAVEAVNKNIKNILAKMAVTYKDWAEKLSFAYEITELLSTHQLGKHPTLWSMVVKQRFQLRWRYNL